LPHPSISYLENRGETEAMPDEEWTTVAQFLEPMNAELAQGRLESAGVESFLVGENTALLYGNGLGGLQLQVMPKDVADAKAILNTVQEGEVPSPEEADDMS
jgi:hypothetical protein